MLSSLISCSSSGSGYYNAISTYCMLEVESIGQRMADRRLVKTSSMPNKKQHVVDFLMTIPQQSKKIFRATVTAIRQSQAGCLVLTVVFDTACSAESTETAIGGGMTKYRKGPQRTAKDPQKTHKGPQRSITQDHRGSAIMRELPNLQQFCLIFK